MLGVVINVKMNEYLMVDLGFVWCNSGIKFTNGLNLRSEDGIDEVLMFESEDAIMQSLTTIFY